SAREWRVHSSIEHIGRDSLDPERIFVQASPQNVEDYLRLREWLDGIQTELDQSWSALGDVYGRSPPLGNLGLNVRRIRSNIDKREDFAQKVNYVPERIAFDIAGPAVLQLLVRPLYGDNPFVGIREIVQNSLDAVRELDNLIERGLASKSECW